MQAVLEDVERSPTRHRGHTYAKEASSRNRLAEFLNVPDQDLAFATNVTMAINMVIHGFTWKPGDEILASDQEYGAINNCLHHAQQRYGIHVRRATIPTPAADPKDILSAFEKGFTERTKLVLCSHIATRTGLIIPIKALAELAHQHGVPIAVDGAHAPGMIPLDLADCNCDFYGGNCHKWLCAPKGTGFIYASPEVQERLSHVVVSWGYNQEGTTRGEDGGLRINDRPFMWGLENWGTRDQACFVGVGAAVDFQEGIGRDRIRDRGKQLAGYLRQRMADTGWAHLLTPQTPEMSGSISAFQLTGFKELELYDPYRITAPTAKNEEGHWIRVSTHICNGFDQIDRLLEALEENRKK